MNVRNLRAVGSLGEAAMDEASDDGLMLRCATGQRAAFDSLVDRYGARVGGFTARYLNDPSQAQDAVQETFVRLWSLRGQYEAKGRFWGFLSKLCLNVCRETARRRRRYDHQLAEFETLPVEGQETPEAALLERERSRRIERAIARLAPKYREVVILRFYAGLAYADMAETLGRGEATLRSRSRVAMGKLREMLGGFE